MQSKIASNHGFDGSIAGFCVGQTIVGRKFNEVRRERINLNWIGLEATNCNHQRPQKDDAKIQFGLHRGYSSPSNDLRILP